MRVHDEVIKEREEYFSKLFIGGGETNVVLDILVILKIIGIICFIDIFLQQDRASIDKDEY